jgi:hypothetical protein
MEKKELSFRSSLIGQFSVLKTVTQQLHILQGLSGFCLSSFLRRMLNSVLSVYTILRADTSHLTNVVKS